MDKSDLKRKFGGLWNVLATASGLTSKDFGAGARCRFSQNLLQIQTPNLYAEAAWLEDYGTTEFRGDELITIINALPDGEVRIQVVDDAKMVLRSGKFRASLSLVEATKELKALEFSVVKREAIPEDLAQALFFAADFADSSNTNLQELTGVYWGPEGLVACNRLSLVFYPEIKRPSTVLIPKTVLLGLQKMEMPLTGVYFSDNNLLRWEFDGAHITSTSLNMQYPMENIKRLLQRSLDTRMQWSCDIDKLKEAVNRASVSEQILFSFQKNRLVVKSTGNIQTTEMVPGTTNGEDFSGRMFVFNVAEAKRILSVSDKVEWGLSGEDGLGVLMVRGDNFYSVSSLTEML